MPAALRHALVGALVLAAAMLGAVGLFLGTGTYDIGADAPHTPPVYQILQFVREQSVAARAGKLALPDLYDPARIRRGAGNYDAMCAGCHLAPGMTETELSKGLYPAPPNLSRARVDPREAFWVIKHGVKASGMPAWGKSMEDEDVWNLVAFLRALPELGAAPYQALVASSGGHSHGGEIGSHSPARGMSNTHHGEGETDHGPGDGQDAGHDD